MVEIKSGIINALFGDWSARGHVLARIVVAVEAAGIEFIGASRGSPGGGEGVRLRR
jgi:hypothetical protein